jgi:hypothetical protein
MKATLIGILLIVLGLAYQGFAHTSRVKILEVASPEAIAETTTTLPVPPIVGGLAVLGGATLLIAASRDRASAV